MSPELLFSTAFVGGIVSIASPCVWPLIPVYIGYISGAANAGPWQIVRNAVGFVLGFSAVFTLFGSGIGLLGSQLLPYFDMIRLVSAGFLIFFGLILLGAFEFLARFSFFRRILEVTRLYLLVGGHVGFSLPVLLSSPSFPMSFLVGVIFAFGWTPCVGPILGSILTIAINFGDWERSTLLLAFYSAGLAVPFLAVSFSLAFLPLLTRILPARASRRVESGKRVAKTFDAWIKRGGIFLQRLAGATLIAFAIAMMLNLFPEITRWLLENF